MKLNIYNFPNLNKQISNQKQPKESKFLSIKIGFLSLQIENIRQIKVKRNFKFNNREPFLLPLFSY